MKEKQTGVELDDWIVAALVEEAVEGRRTQGVRHDVRWGNRSTA